MSSEGWDRTVTSANHLSNACSHIRPSSPGISIACCCPPSGPSSFSPSICIRIFSLRPLFTPLFCSDDAHTHTYFNFNLNITFSSPLHVRHISTCECIAGPPLSLAAARSHSSVFDRLVIHCDSVPWWWAQHDFTGLQSSSSKDKNRQKTECGWSLHPYERVCLTWVFIYNLSHHLHISCPIICIFSCGAIFPDLSIYFDEYNVIITDRSDDQTYKKNLNQDDKIIGCQH